jgi:hypothetical protein
MGMSGQHHTLAAAPLGQTQYHLWAPGPVWMRVENLATTGI